ncbi:MAG: hypothetical protein V4710_24020 [Verrucomicrobiota bacterium]
MIFRILITFCFPAFALLNAADLPPAATLVRTIEWKKEKLPAEARFEAGAPGESGFVSIASSAPVSVTLVSLKPPGIETKSYALRGRIRHRDVEGTGYLQLWNEFPGEAAGSPPNRYFTRTLADTGPMQKIAGTSGWRTVWLPFDATQGKSLPTALELGVVLAGRGTVDLTDLELLQFADAGAMWAALNAEGGQVNFRTPWVWVITLCGGAIALGIFFRRRREAELRRMRAMDFR